MDRRNVFPALLCVLLMVFLSACGRSADQGREVKQEPEQGSGSWQEPYDPANPQSSQESQSLLSTLFDQFEQNNLEEAKNLMRQDEYRALSDSLLDSFDYFEKGTGMGLAVYPDNFYYYGQWQDGLRSGHGVWVQAVFDEDDTRESYLFEGEWANDAPNGEGKITQVHYPEKIHPEPGHTTGIYSEISGTFTDGLFDGTIYEIWNMNDESRHQWTPITAVNGVYQAVDESDGKAIVAWDQEDEWTTLTDSGSIHAILGFKPDPS